MRDKRMRSYKTVGAFINTICVFLAVAIVSVSVLSVVKKGVYGAKTVLFDMICAAFIAFALLLKNRMNRSVIDVMIEDGICKIECVNKNYSVLCDDVRRVEVQKTLFGDTASVRIYAEVNGKKLCLRSFKFYTPRSVPAIDPRIFKRHCRYARYNF